MLGSEVQNVEIAIPAQVAPLATFLTFPYRDFSEYTWGPADNTLLKPFVLKGLQIPTTHREEPLWHRQLVFQAFTKINKQKRSIM